MKKPLEENGIHRAKTWEIACYAANNVSTNTYLMLVSYISYYLIGIVGVGAVLAGSIITIMRVWDGVTDPFVGFVVDKTNGRFGKNRPFIVAGQVILFGMTFCMFRFIPLIPSGGRFIAFILIYMVYIVGYTCQCVVTKSAQSCLTNDPELWCYMQLVIGAIAAVFAAWAILGLWRKDNVKYFGIGKAEKVSFRDYADVLAHNPISSFP